MTSIAQFAIFLRKIVYYEGPFNNRCALGLTAALLKEKNDDATDEVWLSYYKHGEWVWLQNVLFVEIDKKSAAALEQGWRWNLLYYMLQTSEYAYIIYQYVVANWKESSTFHVSVHMNEVGIIQQYAF